MAEQIHHPTFSFHIEGGETSGTNTVPAVVLVQILQSAQQAFELIGIHVEGRSVKVRARVPTSTSKRFRLFCRLPEAGCYAMPVAVGGPGELFQPELAERAYRIFQDMMAGVSKHSATGWSGTLPDERIRRRVLELVRGMAPGAGAGWTVSLHDAQNIPFATFDETTVRFIQDALVPAEQREASRVVTGELKSIDFVARSLTIIYPPTSKELVCLYAEEIEDLLIERRRDLIQVTGRVLLDDDGEPKQLIDVTDIRDLDLTAFEIAAIPRSGGRLLASPPLVLEVFSDDSKQLLCAEDQKLGISAFGHTREALLEELNNQVLMLWREYALASDTDLDGPAHSLKVALRHQFSEVADAAQAE
jgi:hypothetical protein